MGDGGDDMDPSLCALELAGLLFSVGAWLCSLTTTMMSTWLTLSTDLLPAESYELGLWHTCVVQNYHGALECRPYDSLLGLPPEIKLARLLMCAAVGTGLLAVLFVVPGMSAVRSCERTKRLMKAAGGALCLAAGVLGIIPVSYVAHLTVLRFFDESVPAVVPRWEFGDALFCGWTAGLLHLVAAFLLLASSVYLQEDAGSLPIPVRRVCTVTTAQRTRTEYV